MTKTKYVGMDVHSATTVIEVMSAAGKTVSQTVIETRAETLKDFFRGLTGKVEVTFEEGVHAAWLYELIKPLAAEVIVCDPRYNRLVKAGNKGDRIDAHKLAELLRLGSLRRVYHEDNGTEKLREAVRAYNTLTSDCVRVMNRIKAIFRGRGISCAGTEVYRAAHREKWLGKLAEPGARMRLALLYQQFDGLSRLREEARKAMVQQARAHPAYKLLIRVKTLGPVRVAQIIAAVRTPFRFRTKRQFWPYCGLGVETASSADYEIVNGKLRRSKRPTATRGLNRNYNRTLKYVFKSAALQATTTAPFKQHYERLLAKGVRPEMTRLTLARKIAAITLAVWKKGERFDADKLSLSQEA
jgi:transposase